jgi:hypothetical protein
VRSVLAIGLGVLLALGVGLLVVLGILAPLFTAFFDRRYCVWCLDTDLAGTLPTILIAFAAAFAFYFGGMVAGYRAPGRRRLHGFLVAPVAFAISPAINLLREGSLFPDVRTAGTVVWLLVFFAVAIAASYVGGRRGETLHAYNSRVARKRRDSGKDF